VLNEPPLLSEPIQVAERQLWSLFTAIARMPQVPTDLVEQLFQVQLRLTAHVVELRSKKAKLDAARADLEAI
jgi:hypothetical protein